MRNAYAYGENAQGSKAPEALFSKVDPAAVVAGPEWSSAEHRQLHEVNEQYAFVIAGGGSHILWETTDAEDKPVLEHLATSAFHMKHAARKIQLGTKPQKLTDVWMEWPARRSYDGLVFMPEGTPPERFYNIWRGFAVEPAPAGAEHDGVKMWREHLYQNVANGIQGDGLWLERWLAHIVQRPGEKPHTAVVMQGPKGIGKNALIERFGALLGQHFMVASNRRYLLSNFNGHLERMLLFTLDEAFWSGDKASESTLKDLVTGQKHVIEHKGKEPYTVANKTRIAILGNEDWVVPASHDERRFAVYKVGSGRQGQPQWFDRMRLLLEAGGYCVLLRHLMSIDLTGFNPNVAPNTEGLREQKHASLPAHKDWWFSCLQEGRVIGADMSAGWPEFVTCDGMRDAFRRYCAERNIRSWLPSDQRLAVSLGGAVHWVRLRQRQGNTRVWAYTMEKLTAARARWDHHIGHNEAWAAE